MAVDMYAKERKQLAKKWNTTPDKITNKDIADYKNQAGLNVAKRYAGTGLVTAGSSLAANTGRSGALDGIVRRYHNTEAKNIKSIKEHGIKSSHALDADNITSQIVTGLTPEQQGGKIYMAHKPGGAKSVGIQRQRIKDPFGYSINPFKLMSDTHKNQKNLKINIPLNEYNALNKVKNPELRGANNYKEFIDILGKNNFQIGMMPQAQKEAYGKKAWKLLNDQTDTIQGDIASKFIKGGKGYQKQTLKGIAKHIKDNPKMFAKGAAKAGLGLGAAGLGAGVLLNSFKPIKRKEASNMNYKNQIEKMAAFNLRDMLSEQSKNNMSRARSEARMASNFSEKAKNMGQSLKNESVGSALKNLAKRDKMIGNAKLAGKIGLGAAAAGAGAYGLNKLTKKEKTASDIVNDVFEKIASSRDDDTKTKFFRDRFNPEFKRGFISMAGGIPGIALAGIANSRAIKSNPDAILDFMNGKLPKGVAAGTALAGLGAAGLNSYLKHRDLNKLSEKYLGEKPTIKDEIKTQIGPALSAAGGFVPQLGLPAGIANLASTPEAIVQKKRRERDLLK